MSKMIQLQIPDTLHRVLKARAVTLGTSVSDYLLMEIAEIVQKPSLSELRKRLQSRERVSRQFNAAEILRKERAQR